MTASWSARQPWRSRPSPLHSGPRLRRSAPPGVGQRPAAFAVDLGIIVNPKPGRPARGRRELKPSVFAMMFFWMKIFGGTSEITTAPRR